MTASTVIVGMTALSGCSRTATPAAGVPPSSGSASATSTALSPAPRPDLGAPSSASSSAPSSAPADKHFLTVARRVYPQIDDALLVTKGKDICLRLSARSVHDVVGTLAGQLGSQSQAKEIVDAAAAAFCAASVSLPVTTS